MVCAAATSFVAQTLNMRTPQPALPLLKSLEERTEQQLQTALRVFQNLAPAALNSAPAPGRWSVAACLWHLNSYGNHYYPRIAAALKKGGPQSTHFTSTWLGAYFTKMMEPGPGMKKIKTFKSHEPPLSANDPVADVHEFIRQLEWLLVLLREAREADLNRIRIPITLTTLIRLRLGDVFQFIVAHNERHVQQALRACATHHAGDVLSTTVNVVP